MDIAATLEHLRCSFLDGTPKRMLIDGQWVDARGGKTITSFDPSTGEAVAEIAAASPEDIDAAVAAARRAFEGPRDYMRVVGTIPADEAFRPLSQSECPLVKK